MGIITIKTSGLAKHSRQTHAGASAGPELAPKKRSATITANAGNRGRMYAGSFDRVSENKTNVKSTQALSMAHACWRTGSNCRQCARLHSQPSNTVHGRNP